MDHKDAEGGEKPCSPGRMNAPRDERTVQEAWDRHFIAFSEQDVEKIVLDYDDESLITIFDQTAGTKTVYEGAEGARALFTWFFTAFTNGDDLDTVLADVCEDSRTVFFVWKLPAVGFPDGTDTLLFGKNNKVRRQTAAFRTA